MISKSENLTIQDDVKALAKCVSVHNSLIIFKRLLKDHSRNFSLNLIFFNYFYSCTVIFTQVCNFFLFSSAGLLFCSQLIWAHLITFCLGLTIRSSIFFYIFKFRSKTSFSILTQGNSIMFIFVRWDKIKFWKIVTFFSKKSAQKSFG